MKKQGFNPYLPSWEYIPDGEPHVFDGRVYVFGSHDRFGGHTYCPNDYVCWSAPVDDLSDWQYEGVIYARTDDPANKDGDMLLFAPDVTRGADGRYYLYYVLDQLPVISVAVCDTPAGRYQFYGYVHHPDGSRLGERDGDAPQFDPGVLFEKNVVYLYTGFCPPADVSRRGAMVTVLEPDMLTVRTEPVTIVPSALYAAGTSFEDFPFFEASSIRRVGNSYYFIYSPISNHELCYARSSSPLGPFTFVGVIVSNSDLHIDTYKPADQPMFYGGNNHGSIEKIQEQWYVFYHRHTNGTNFSRQGCIEPIHILPDGTIPQVELTSCGGNGGPLAGCGEYPAHIICNLYCQHVACTTGKPGDWMDCRFPRITQDAPDGNQGFAHIGNMRNGAAAGFKYFQCNGVRRISVKVRGNAGTYQIRTQWDGPVIGEIPVGHSNEWKTFGADVALPDGINALYFSYHGQGISNLASFTLEADGGTAMKRYKNPIIDSDFPDPDIIRVGDTYYMASTTMYLMPGGDILRSRDLVHWEFVCHVFSQLEDNPAHRLEDGQEIYGLGMWAPSLRFHGGAFYLTFACNDTHKSLLFRAKDPAGPWERLEMGGFFYDSSLFFDDDGRAYIVHGNTQLWITELEAETWGPKPGGLDRVIVTDRSGQTLGYEGSHLYKKDGRYYLFTCHMPQGSRFLKTEDCFLADSLSGPWRGKNILDDNMGYRDFGVAQGGMVDTPEGDWYAFMFQDRGPLGRAPVIMPMTFDAEGFPILGDHGRVPKLVYPVRTDDGPACAPLNGDDDFRYTPDADGSIRLAPFWQFSHNPDPAGWSVTARPGTFRLTTRRTSPNLILARNTLTQRCVGPQCAAWVTLDGTGLREGDYAGICAYQSCYGAIALTRRNGAYWLVMLGRPADNESNQGDGDFARPPVEYGCVPAPGPVVTLRCDADFSHEPDTARFSCRDTGGSWRPLGIAQRLYYKLDLFIGYRFGLFCYSTLKAGGTADFSAFHFQGPQE